MAHLRAAGSQSGRRLGYGYVSLAHVIELAAQGKINTKVNLYAAIYEKHDVRSTSGTDLVMNLYLMDPTTDSNDGQQAVAVECLIFAKDIHEFPQLRPQQGQHAFGFDIIRLHRVTVKQYNGKPQLVAQIRSGAGGERNSSSFALFQGSPSHTSLIPPYQPYHHSHNNYSAVDAARLETLRCWIFDRAAYMNQVEDGNSKLKKVQHLRAAALRPHAPPDIVDIICKVLAVDLQHYDAGYVVVWVWDGTDAEPVSPAITTRPPQPPKTEPPLQPVACDEQRAMPYQSFASPRTAADGATEWILHSGALSSTHMPAGGSAVPVLLPLHFQPPVPSTAAQDLLARPQTRSSGTAATAGARRAGDGAPSSLAQPGGQPAGPAEPGASTSWRQDLPKVGVWYKFKYLGPFIVQGQTQLMGYSQTRWNPRAEEACKRLMEDYQKRLQLAGKRNISLGMYAPPNTRLLARAMLPHLKKVTIRQVHMMAEACDSLEVQVVARITACSPSIQDAALMTKPAAYMHVVDELLEVRHAQGVVEVDRDELMTYCLRLELQDATGTLHAVLLGAAAEQFFSQLPARNFVEPSQQQEGEVERDSVVAAREARTKRRELEQLKRDNEVALQQLQGVMSRLLDQEEGGTWVEVAIQPLYRFKDNPWQSVLYRIVDTELVSPML